MKIDVWRYAQLSQFVKKLPQPLRDVEDYRPLEQLCLREKSKNNISRLYKIQMIGDESDVPPYIKKWEIELGSQCNQHVVDKILTLSHYSSVDTKTTETNYKCLARWYATPDKISTFIPEKSAEYWRGCKAQGTMSHIWWECPIIIVYWKEFLQLIKVITNEVKDPWTCLFHGTADSVRQYKASIVSILLNTAKSQIPKK